MLKTFLFPTWKQSSSSLKSIKSPSVVPLFMFYRFQSPISPEFTPVCLSTVCRLAHCVDFPVHMVPESPIFGSPCNWQILMHTKKVVKPHEDYGDFVRIESNNLSIIHPLPVNAIYRLGSKCRKSDWYSLSQPMVSVQTTRHEAVHDKRRRIWSNAFSDKALRVYQYRIMVYIGTGWSLGLLLAVIKG